MSQQQQQANTQKDRFIIGWSIASNIVVETDIEGGSLLSCSRPRFDSVDEQMIYIWPSDADPLRITTQQDRPLAIQQRSDIFRCTS